MDGSDGESLTAADVVTGLPTPLFPWEQLSWTGTVRMPCRDHHFLRGATP
jgi:hypothetical protein